MKAIVTLIFSWASVVLWAQAPAVEWDKSFGTSSQEFGRALVKTQDGGYLMGGEVSVASNDFLVIKVDAAGNETWRYSYDNNGNYDRLNSIAENIDGGFVLGGYSYSSTVGNYDYWIVKINANGITEWTVQLDGNSTDMLEAIKVDPFGDIVAGGYSISGVGGDKTEPSRGGYDMWIVKLNNNGYKIWDKTIGGSSDDFLMSIDITSTGDYLLGGYSYSSVSGEKTEMSQGGSDYWIVKTNNAGNIIWNKTIGGSSADVLSDIKELPNGEITLAGYSQSVASGDKTQNTFYYPQTVSYTNCYRRSYSCGWSTCYETVCYPVYYTNYDTDYWIVKLSASGGKIWDRDFGSGGSFPYDNATNVSVLNGEILITGYSNGNANGIKSENSRGGSDAWLIKLDLNGNKLWDKTIGGNNNDQSDTNESVVINGGKITFLASSYSPVSGDKSSPNFGGSDFWLVSLVTEAGDEEPPVISGVPVDILAENDPGSCSVSVTWIPPTATDNKGVVSFTSNYQPGDLFSYGATQVIYTAQDAAGNTTEASFYVYVQDNEAPLFPYTPEDIVVEVTAESCSAIVELPEVAVLDNCEEIFLFVTRSDGEEIPLTDPFPVGVTVITYEAYDLAENLASMSFRVTVIDAQAPTFNSEDVLIETNAAEGQCSAVVELPVIEAYDNCGVTLTQHFDLDGIEIPDPGNVFQVGTTTITYTATDDSGNTTVLTVSVVVHDVELPVIDPPALIEVDAALGDCGATISFSMEQTAAIYSFPAPTASDNCGIASITHDFGSDYFPVGITLITWTVVDVHGNSSTTTQTIIVRDTSPPVFSQPENITLSACDPIGVWAAPVAVDACGDVVVQQVEGPESGSVFEPGTTTTISYIATDAWGNEATTSFTVTRDAELTVLVTTEDGTCDNGNLGNITTEVLGGLAPYTYSWNTGEITSDLNDLPAGEYILTVTDARGCHVEQTIVINSVPCCNVTAGGAIINDESNCGPFDPAPITSVELPTGGLGDLEYVWVATTNPDLSSTIVVLEYSNSSEYDPAPITETTWYRRGARRAGCVEFVGESNWVKKEVIQNVTSAGIIAADQQNCGPFTPAQLTSTSPATGGLGEVIEYQWMSSTVDVPNTVGNPYWQPIAGATDLTYQPGELSQTTYFIRCARVQGCSFIGATTESNKVTVAVHPVPTATITAVNGTCLNGNKGSASVTAVNGTEPYSYVWNTGATTASIAGLSAGQYSVTISDAKGCSVTATTTITTEICQIINDLNLTSECYDDPAERNWRITNPNDFDVEVTWVVYGTSQTGTLIATPGLTHFITQAVLGPNTTIIKWLNEKGEVRQVTKASSNKPCCSPTAITTRVVDFDQGKRKDGKAIVDYRSNPENALGNGDAKDKPHGIRFVSLGFGGSITLEFDNPLCDNPGLDLRVYETTYGNPMFALYPEQAEVFVSQDGTTWKSLGRTNTTTPSINCRVKLDTDFDFGSVYPWIKYVRVVDVTNPNALMLNPAKCTPLPVSVFNKVSDGFDLDAVESLHGGKQWHSDGRVMADVEEDNDPILITNPSSLIYPNPVERELLIDLEEEEEFVFKEDETVQVEILDMKGIRHNALQHNLDQGLTIRCDVTSLAPGLYLARTQTNGITRTYKFVKQ
jgi:hypothetical protein